MTYIGKSLGAHDPEHDSESESEQVVREALVIVVEDDSTLSDGFRAVCDCLNVAVEQLPSHDDLGAALRERRPMAVVAAMEAAGQDGCHVLKTVAAHDRNLPVLMITGDESALLGAIDAVEEIWGLSYVVKWPRLSGVGPLVDFLFRAGRKGGCMRLMSV